MTLYWLEWRIRSYVLDDARIKDLRTGVECRDTQKVLNGDLDQFIEAFLQAQWKGLPTGSDDSDENM